MSPFYTSIVKSLLSISSFLGGDLSMIAIFDRKEQVKQVRLTLFLILFRKGMLGPIILGEAIRNSRLLMLRNYENLTVVSSFSASH